MDNPSAMIPTLPPIDNTYGALFLGTSVGLVLYGLLVHQSFCYFRKFPKERGRIKAFVVIILALETVHSAFSVQCCYTHLVSDYGHPEDLLRPTLSMSLLPMLTGLVTLASQWPRSAFMHIECSSFAFAVSTGVVYRIIGAAAVVFSTVTLGCTLATTIVSFSGTLETILRHVKWFDFVAVAAAIVSDTLTAGVLVSFLRKSRTGLKRTDSLIDRLVAYCLSTGLLIGITNAALCIVSIFQSEALLFFGIVIAATKLYSNSVLVALNIRRSPLEGAEQTYPELILLSDVGAAAHRTPAANGLNRSPAATGAATRLAASAPSLQSDHGEDAYGFRGAFKVEAAGIC